MPFDNLRKLLITVVLIIEKLSSTKRFHVFDFVEVVSKAVFAMTSMQMLVTSGLTGHPIAQQ